MTNGMRAATLIHGTHGSGAPRTESRYSSEAGERNRSFVHRQLRSPYGLRHHTHEFVALGGGTLLGDRVRYAVTLGQLGTDAHTLVVPRDLDNLFAYWGSALTGLPG